MLANWPCSTETQSPTRLPACSETMRMVLVPPISTVYSKACVRVTLSPTRPPTAAPPTVRSARLLLEFPLPEASPMPPPTSLPTLRPVLSSTVVCLTAVMRPYCTRLCA
jgi:hypothetical protein